MVDKKNNTILGFSSLIVGMLFYSLSGVMVTWLGIAFSPGAQLIVRAAVAIIVSVLWILVSKSGIHLKGHYSKKYLVLDIVTRPLFNFCFIMAVFGFREATFALLLLFTAKVITGGFIAKFVNKEKLGWLDVLCYLLALGGILVYNWGGVFQLVFIWAIISGVLEAIKSQSMAKLDVETKDKPIISLLEFSGVAVVGVVVWALLNNFVFVLPNTATTGPILGFVTQTFLGIGVTYWGIALAVTAVLALAFELYGFSNFSPDLGNIILATELGVAGVINYLLLNTAQHPIAFGGQQIIALLIFIIAAIFVSKAGSIRNKKKVQKVIG